MTDTNPQSSETQTVNTPTPESEPVATQTPETKKPSKLPVFIVGGIVAVFLLVLCVILTAVAIIAVNPAEKLVEPTPTGIVFEPTETSPTAVPTQTITPTSGPYLGWENYTNEDLGISLKYPSNYLLTSTPSGISLSSSLENESGTNAVTLNISLQSSIPDDYEEVYESQGVRKQELDRTIYIDGVAYTTKAYFSGEGSPGPENGQVWQGSWDDELLEIPNLYITTSLHTSTILDENKKVISKNEPSQEQKEQKDLILRSIAYL